MMKRAKDQGNYRLMDHTSLSIICEVWLVILYQINMTSAWKTNALTFCTPSKTLGPMEQVCVQTRAQVLSMLQDASTCTGGYDNSDTCRPNLAKQKMFSKT